MTRDDVLEGLARILRTTAMSPEDIDAMQQSWLDWYPSAATDIRRVCAEIRKEMWPDRVEIEPTEEQMQAVFAISDKRGWRAVCSSTDVALLLARREAALQARIEKLEMALSEERNGGEG